MIEVLYLEFVMMILFAIQLTNSHDPAGVRVDSERQLIIVEWLADDGQWNDPVSDLGVVGIIGIVGLDADNTVTDWNVFHDRFLEE